jgi:hypothetical protein
LKWAESYVTMTLKGADFDNIHAFNDHNELSQEFKEAAIDYAYKQRISKLYHRRSPFFDLYANKINLYEGEV